MPKQWAYGLPTAGLHFHLQMLQKRLWLLSTFSFESNCFVWECKRCVEKEINNISRSSENQSNPPPPYLFPWKTFHQFGNEIKSMSCQLKKYWQHKHCPGLQEVGKENRAPQKAQAQSWKCDLPCFDLPCQVKAAQFVVKAGIQRLEALLVPRPARDNVVFDRNLTPCHAQVVLSCKASPLKIFACHKMNEEFDLPSPWLEFAWTRFFGRNLTRQRFPLASLLRFLVRHKTLIAFLTSLISSPEWNQNLHEKQTRWENKVNQLQKPFQKPVL